MCNRYRRHLTRFRGVSFKQIRAWLDQPLDPGPVEDVFPDRVAAVIRATTDGGFEEIDMRWGFPPPPNLGKAPVTNVRNTGSSYWKPWLKPAQRCLVPAVSFAEWTDASPKREKWFALPDQRPFFFAGIWRPWTGTRGTKAAPVTGEHLVYSFLTTEPNGVVRPYHSKAMPAILATAEEAEMWMMAPTDVALALQRPLPERHLHVLEAA